MKKMLAILIDIYRSAVSPFLGLNCRFEPCCSEYLKQAVASRGALSGLAIGLRRLLRCHPFSRGGYDPLGR